MKKTLTLLVALLLCVSLFCGCSRLEYEGSISCVSHLEADGTATMIDLSENVQTEVVAMLNSDCWINDLTNCGHDFEFTIDNATICYHSECGTFNDISNHRALNLSDEDRAKINSLLGISDYKEPDFEPIKYTCDLSKYPTREDCMGYGEITEILDGKLLVVPGSSQDKIEFGEAVYLICDEAWAYSIGQVVTYTFRDVKAPNKVGEPLNIITSLVYMEQ